MATLTETPNRIEIPVLPSKTVKEFIPYLAKHPKTAIGTLLEPYKAFESELRKVYAQQPDHEVVKDGTVNLVPIFDGHEQDLVIRARDLGTETEDEKSKYIMPLSPEDRKPNGAPAVVSYFKDFQQNFNLFSESALTDLDWNNVVAAGSAVTTALLPVPEKWAESKRSMREYYHEHLAPASDVDLFLYGLNEEQALEKIKQIEKNIKDSILHETTTIRTKNAITIASQYPTRHVQIVLRLYDSISQIITGFDVDCACAAYDGKQVYAAPRAIAAFVTQCNTIDLTRRSPSYENRLSKYSHRGFEVYWPVLDRTRVDPTIFERSFGRTQGLARLLVLEKLPKSADRDSYMDQRRAERGRPTIHRSYRNQYKMGGNIKDLEEDEVAEWVEQEEVASYHTMTVPYGPKYHAGRINRLLYAKDLLLNAEWNRPEDREVYLHRHPCFFGTAEEVLEDCCGYCPVPKTDEEHKVAEEESKTYISGKLKFLMDDPGRQEIGSFNPITDDEWTTMAYVGDTARLCQAIVDGDLEHVQDWCSQEGVDVNRRDYTGRTPLHLATMASTPEIVQCLIDHGARMIARLVDGRTALHIAAARGNAEMVKALMDRSLANEEEEDEKEESRLVTKRAERAAKENGSDDKEQESDAESEASEITLESEEDKDSVTMGSFVKIEKDKQAADEGVPEDSSEDPDVYEIDVIAWDYGLSPLHLAILNGHLEIVDLLVSEYGADVLLPVKLMHPGTNDARGAIMTIVLAMFLDTEKAKAMAKLLLQLGATSAQADMHHFTAFHYIVSQNHHDILDVLLSDDRPIALSVLNNVGTRQYAAQDGETPLAIAVEKGYTEMAAKLLALGAKPAVEFDEWVKMYLAKNEWARRQNSENNLSQYHSSVVQPIIAAACKENCKTVEDLVAHGADPCTLEKSAYSLVQNPQNYSYVTGETVLDIIQKKLKALREWKNPGTTQKAPEKLRAKPSYLYGLTEGTYEYWSAEQDYESKKKSNESEWKNWEENYNQQNQDGLEEKKAAIAKLIEELERAEKALIDAGGKTFAKLHPQIPKRPENVSHQYQYPDPDPYKTTFNFRDPALNDIKKDGYKQLFEAAWNNDLEKIKAITLAPWNWKDSKVLEPPLRVAIQDSNGFSPFSIAVLRGHRELARKLVEICATQYHQDDGLSSRQRWNMRNFGDSDDGESDDGEGLPIFSELVSDKFTVDNLGNVSNIVKSDVLPLSMIEWECLPYRILNPDHEYRDVNMQVLESAIYTDDMNLLKFIIELGTEQQAFLAQEEDDQTCYSINRSAFLTAIRLGRTAMLAEMIKTTGVGIPLNELIQQSGVEIKTKPRYYQGLSVGGKKRADWAQAPGDNVQVIEEKIPPLLRAAVAGSIDSVEWFMSDAPMRRYKEFAETNKHDKRIKTLEASGKGFDKIIGTWLNTKAELVLHSAVLYNPPKGKADNMHLALLKHLISVVPETLEQKSSGGWTPLHVAVITHRVNIISYLISAGANQRSRDKMGRNMIHSMLISPRLSRQWTKVDLERLQDMLDLFDKDAIKEMLLERCTDSPGALTPLAYWMANNRGDYKGIEVISSLLKLSTGEELEMINGEGDLPVHVAIKNSLSTQTQLLLSLKPSLLFRENATGRTPLEMSRDMYIASSVQDPPSINNHNRYYYPGSVDYNSMIHKPLSDFVVKKAVPEQSKKRTWEVCSELNEVLRKEDGEKGGERKRRLVSLIEANEVAKRVTTMKRRRGGYQTVVNGGLVDNEVKPDVFSEWMYLGN